MQKFKTFLILLLFAGAVTPVGAQDFIYTQFDMAPLLYNPAKAGDYFGNLRVGGIYRDRTSAITAHRMQTPSFYLDSPLFKGFGKNDWVGIGGQLFQDNSGTGDLVTGEMRLSLAYHLGLSRKGKNYLSIGVHGGTYWRNFKNSDLLVFEDEILTPGTVSPDKNTLIGENSDTRFSMGLGLQLTTQPNKKTDLKLGVSTTHFFFYNYGLTSQRELNIPLMFIGHAELDYKVNNRMSFHPKVVSQILRGGFQLSAMSYMRYKLNPESDFYLNPGLGYRLGDAAFIIAGVGWKQLQVRAAYDLTLNKFISANRSFGAIEFGLIYTMKFPKAPKVERAIICPKL